MCTPLPYNADFTPRNEHEAPLDSKSHHFYRSVIGGLFYLATYSWSDITFSMAALARILHNPLFCHLGMAKRICRYVKGTLHYGLQFSCRQVISPCSLRGAVDSDWGGCRNSWRSTWGFLFAMNSTPILWRSKRQTLVALSSAEENRFPGLYLQEKLPGYVVWFMKWWIRSPGMRI